MSKLRFAASTLAVKLRPLAVKLRPVVCTARLMSVATLSFFILGGWSGATGQEVVQEPSDWLAEAQLADKSGRWKDSKRACDAALASNTDLALAYYFRGRAQFCLSNFAASVRDFDQYVKRAPAAASRQWERGISCYYSREYEAGAKQFALYQTYHDNDVENSVWRYLCMAKLPSKNGKSSLLVARDSILPIRNDRRRGMMKVYDLYRGKASVKEVLAAAAPTVATPSTGPLFYARLYVGLYHEVNERPKEAAQFIHLAAVEHRKDAEMGRINRHMFEVAVVHDAMLRKDMPKKGAPKHAPLEDTGSAK